MWVLSLLLGRASVKSSILQLYGLILTCELGLDKWLSYFISINTVETFDVTEENKITIRGVYD